MSIIDQYAAAERLISDMTKGSNDEQARARLVEIALAAATRAKFGGMTPDPLTFPEGVRRRAGFKNPRTGSWCAAGLTAAMEDAGLVVPAPGTSARRGAVALLDFVFFHATERALKFPNGVKPTTPLTDILDERITEGSIAPGDIIAWLQHPPGKDPAGWRRGHVALIVAVDGESITTVGWNEGAAPGRVMRRRLWRDEFGPWVYSPEFERDIRSKRPRSSTVLYRRPGGIYGIVRPVAR